ncbi:inhibitor of growth protein 1-like [Patiria miniata]|uniref:Zinc finger PHD-type domain-containing protein n=1 Tax=Patiria miniata TaxID=46514 RepID=A0A914AF03_PATMI|nr:inhibitor of growth protein 1-like [Patiria miniata]
MGLPRMRTAPAPCCKMAAHGKDDFVTGSDLSDLSDVSDEEFDENEVAELDYESEDDGRQYCVCGEPSTMEMIACDDDQCTVVWWHYSCAGVCADTIPDTWVCSRCLPGTTEEIDSSPGPDPTVSRPPRSQKTRQKPKKTSETTDAVTTDALPSAKKDKKA